MIPKKLVPLAVAVMMALPTLLIMTPASAQETVPIAPTVEWKDLPNKLQSLYVRFSNQSAPTTTNPQNGGTVGGSQLTTDPDCRTAASATGDTSWRPHTLQVYPLIQQVDPRTGVQDNRPSCTFDAATLAPGGQPPVVEFTFRPGEGLLQEFNATGNRSLIYVHKGLVPAGVTLTVSLGTANDRPIDTATITGTGKSSYAAPFELGEQVVPFFRGEELQISIQGHADASITPNPQNLPRWSISDAGHDGSRLEVRANDAIKLATWTTNEHGQVQNLFRPLQMNASADVRIRGAFAVRSAFGLEDARAGDAPEFVILRDGKPVDITPDRIGSVTGVYSDTLSQASDGRAVWTFPSSLWDYRDAPGGEYTLIANKAYHQGGAFTGLGTQSTFLISTQSVVLKPYDDADPSTTPSPLESSAHDMLPGGRTTYVFLVNNTGSVNDTFRLDPIFLSGTPSTGWAATVGGPDTRGNEVNVPPGEQRLVTLTIAAPAGTRTGDSAIFQLRASSTVDPTVVPATATVVSTVSEVVTHAVDLIVSQRRVEIEPARDHVVDVYVWNRGSRAANLSLELTEGATAGWDIDLLMGNLGVSQLQLPNVAPGDIVRARLRVNGPIDLPDSTSEVGLLARNADLSGITRESSITFVLKPTASVRLQVLEEIQGSGHFVETFQAGDDEPDSSADGTWFRVWVTNTGNRRDNFTLTLDTFSWSEGTRLNGLMKCEDGVFLNRNGNHGEHPDDFAVFQRDARGGAGNRNTVDLAPGDTGELYVWRRAVDTARLCGAPDFFDFVITATGQQTRAVAREGVRVVAEDRQTSDSTVPPPKVLVEAVARDEEYGTNAIVDITHADKRSVEGAVRVGENATYYVRVTNGASWTNYTDENGRHVRPDIEVTSLAVASERGWNVSMRLVNGDTNEETNPFLPNLTLKPLVDAREETWMDYEIELRVQAPNAANGTALAGEQEEFTIQASIPGTPASSSLAIKTIVSEFSLLRLDPETPDKFTRAHPGEPGAYLVTVSNDGSAPAEVRLHANMEEAGTINANAWTVLPNEERFTLPAFTNRTVALVMTPPQTATPGQTGRIDVTVEYPEFPGRPHQTRNETIEVTVEVTPRKTLRLDSVVRERQIAPDGLADFNLTLRNEGGATVEYRVTGTPVPNWTATLGSTGGTLQGNEQRPLVYVLDAPDSVKNNSRFASIVRVVDVTDETNFDVFPVYVNVRGGSAIASVSTPVLEKTVDRDGFQNFEVLVKNVGTARDFIPLTVRTSDDRNEWTASIVNDRDEPITGVTLGPNEAAKVNVTVGAPLTAAENAVVRVELTAFAPDYSQSAKAILTARIHDYGITMDLQPSRLDVFAGVPKEFIVTLRNTGNDNDTLNVSANLIDLPEWRVEFSTDRVRLEKGQQAEVRATVKMPTAPLPTSRTYDLQFYASSLGATEVNISRNMTRIGVVNVLEYRSIDVDGDGRLEMAADENKRREDGYETFREVFTDGVQSVLVARATFNGKAAYLLDVPGENPYDGVADRWFDPELVWTYPIRHNADIDGDASPDYFLDTDRDREGKIDKAYDTVGETFWNVVQVEVYGDDRIQFLVDTNADGRPDRFFDPETNKVTKTLPVSGANQVGIDTDDDGRVNKVYDVNSGDVTDAKLRNFSEFAVEFWYFFALFAAFVLVTVFLLVRRFRA